MSTSSGREHSEQGLRKAEGEDARLGDGLEDAVPTLVGEAADPPSQDSDTFAVSMSDISLSNSCLSSIGEQSGTKRCKSGLTAVKLLKHDQKNLNQVLTVDQA